MSRMMRNKWVNRTPLIDYRFVALVSSHDDTKYSPLCGPGYPRRYVLNGFLCSRLIKVDYE